MARSASKLRFVLVFMITAVSIAAAPSQAIAQQFDLGFPVQRTCKLIAREAAANGIPLPFFARLIWKESGFDAAAISPDGAEGIAQFMPDTAEEVGLENPFDPELAIPASAKFLNQLRLKKGNLGLAAAAYNAGEARVDRWLRQGGNLPVETENYVLDLTGETADSFYDRRRQIKNRPLDGDLSFMEACIRLPLMNAGIGQVARGLTMPWAIQVAGNFDRAAAQRSWERIRNRNASILAGLPYAISRSRTARGARGIYTVRLGAASRVTANAICGQLRQNGTPCVVQRN